MNYIADTILRVLEKCIKVPKQFSNDFIKTRYTMHFNKVTRKFQKISLKNCDCIKSEKKRNLEYWSNKKKLPKLRAITACGYFSIFRKNYWITLWLTFLRHEKKGQDC